MRTNRQSFIPINVYEEDLVQDAEEHTRELQIEEGYKVFQKALQCQKDNDIKEAHDLYDALFEIEVMKLSREQSPPAADKLKYLASKNYALLMLTDLKSKIAELDEEDLSREVEEILWEISEALIYESEEPAFLELVYLISKQLGYTREARLALESIIYSDERIVAIQDMYLAGSALAPQDYKTLINLRNLLESIGDDTTLNHNELMKSVKGIELNPLLKITNEDYSWLTETSINLTDSYQRLIDRENDSRQLDITITSKDWLSILSALQDKVWSLTKTKRKMPFEDPYGYSDDPVTVVRFHLPHGLEAAAAVRDRQNETDLDEKQKLETKEKHDQQQEQQLRQEQQQQANSSSKKRRRKSDYDELRYRSSKRVREMDQPIGTASSAQEEDEFFDQLNKLLEHANVKFEPVLPVVSLEEYEKKDQVLFDFKSALLSWDDSQAEVFLRKEAVPNVKKHSSQPVMQMLDFAALGDGEMMTRRSISSAQEGVDDFLKTMQNGKFHMQETRVKVLDNLLAQRNNRIAILEDYWPERLLQLVRKTAESCEPMLFTRAKASLGACEENSGDATAQLEIAQSICEIFIESYLSVEKSSRSRDKSSREIKEIEFLLAANKARYERWLGLCGDLISTHSTVDSSIRARHEWATILTISNPSTSLKLLESFLEKVSSTVPELDVKFVNFSNIPKLSVESITTQISKFRAASVFTKVFEIEEQEQQDQDQEQECSRIAILESILMPTEHPNVIPENDSISQFMSTASLEFRLQLWYLLLDGYDANGQSSKSFDGYLRILISSVDEFDSENSTVTSDHERGVVLLRSLNICLDISRKLVKLTMEDGTLLNQLSEDVLKKSFDAILKLLRILRIYVLLDDAIINNNVQAPSHPSWDRAAKQFKELVLRSWYLLYKFYKQTLSEETIKENPILLNDLLSMIHEDVGSRYYCGLGDGFFLKMALREIADVDDEDTELDMLQCLHCRYGFTLGYEPYDHHSTPVDLNRSESTELIGFIMRVILSKKNILQTLQRMDVRAVLEELHSSLGDPDESSLPTIAQNKSVLNRYLDTTVITASFLQGSLAGRLSLSFFSCHNDEIGRIGDSGFYYIQGLTHLTQYKQRAKQNIARASDVEEAIEYFMCDLMCNTNRFESWFGLAECYDALATLDLTMSSDKINSLELRAIPSGHQRKSIVSCCMAISVHLQTRMANQASGVKYKPLTAHYQQQVSNLWPFFAKVLFQSSRSPMKMEAFATLNNKFYFSDEANLYQPEQKTTLSRKLVWKVADQSLKVALNTRKDPKEDDWTIHQLRAKVLNKLGLYDEALESISAAVRLVENDPKSDQLDACYKLVSMTYKYVRNGHITPEKAAEFLQSTTHLSQNSSSTSSDFIADAPDTPEYQFYFLCVHTLQRIKHADKKKILHRPSYRLAKIFDQVYADVSRAKEEMAPFFNKGAAGAKPIIIWRHELERPGRHYEFMYEYIVFFISLLERTQDTAQLALLLRRLRRFNGSMARRMDAWETVCQATARTAKTIMNIPEGYSDSKIAVLPADHFEHVTTKMHEEITENKFKTEYADWMMYGDDKKKLNNGMGSTSNLDDLFVCIYLKIYFEYVGLHPELNRVSYYYNQPSSPDGAAASKETNPSTPVPTAASEQELTVNEASTTPKQESVVPEPATEPSTPSMAVRTNSEQGNITPQASQTGHNSTETTPQNGQQSLQQQIHVPPKMRVTRKLIMTKGKDLVRILATERKDGGVSTGTGTPVKTKPSTPEPETNPPSAETTPS